MYLFCISNGDKLNHCVPYIIKLTPIESQSVMRESYVLVTKSLLEVIFMDIGEKNRPS